MKIVLSFMLLATFGKSAHAAELNSCISESVAGVTNCVIQDCPVAADECMYQTANDDTCAQFESSCTELMTKCCAGECRGAMASLMECTVGAVVCAGTDYTCGARRLEESNLKPRKLQTGFACLSEATAAYSKCLINNCPGADQACTTVTPDADTCADVASMCPELNACCPACQEPLEALLNCATGEVCTDFDCMAGTSSVAAVDTADSSVVAGGTAGQVGEPGDADGDGVVEGDGVTPGVPATAGGQAGAAVTPGAEAEGEATPAPTPEDTSSGVSTGMMAALGALGAMMVLV